MYCYLAGCLFFMVTTLISRRSAADILPGMSSDQVKTRTQDATTTVYACMMINRNSSGQLIFDFSKAGAAVELGLDYVRTNLIPANVELKMIYTDLGPTCQSKSTAMGEALKLWDQGIQCSVYIGPGCTVSVQTLYNLAFFQQVPIIGLPGDGMGTQADMSAYPFLSRISVTHTNTAYVIIKFLIMFNYTNAFFIGQTDTISDFYENMFTVATTVVTNSNPMFTYTMKFRTYSAQDGPLSKQAGKILVEITSSARVVFLLMTGDQVRDFMIAASQADMVNSEYVYLAVELFPSQSFGKFSWDYGNSNDEIANSAFQSLLLIAIKPQYGADYEVFQADVKKNSPKFGYTYGLQEEVEVIVGHFYDAIIMYGNIISQLAAAGFDANDSVQAANFTQNSLTFISPINGRITLDTNGDRHSDYIIQKFSKLTNRYEPFLDCPDASPVPTLIGDLQWRERDALPLNEPLCGYRGDQIICRINGTVLTTGEKAAAVLIPILAFMGMVAGITVGVQRFLYNQSNPYWWRVFMHELEGMDSHSVSAKSNLTGRQSTISSHAKLGTIDEKDEEKLSIHTGSVIAKTELSSSVQTALYDGNLVTLVDLPEPKTRAQPWIGRDLRPLKRIQHTNIQTFIGIAVSDENLCIYLIGEICQKGTLESMLRVDVLHLDDPFKFSLINDLIIGMVHLQSTPLLSHGNLMDTTCLIDSRFVLKICSHGLGGFRSFEELEAPFDHQDDRDFRPLMWRAPELLHRPMLPQGTQKGDVYSFAILVQQIVLVRPPYGTHASSWHTMTNSNMKEIVMEVKKGAVPPVRPRVPRLGCPSYLHDLMDECWHEDPEQRPTFIRIQDQLRKVPGFARQNVVDHLIKRMEQYAENLEGRIAETVKGFMEEKKRSEEVLYSILPRFVAEMINSGTVLRPETHESTTVYFSHLIGWENIIALTRSPLELTQALNAFYSTCDTIIEKHDAYKVETVTDSYMIVSGLPVSNGTQHVMIIATMSLELLNAVKGRSFTSSFNTSCRMRIGVNSGPCVAGVIGLKLPKYCLFGDTVNTASRMESNGEAGKIHISNTTYDLLRHYHNFDLEDRGERDIKGKGLMHTYWLNGYVDPKRKP